MQTKTKAWINLTLFVLTLIVNTLGGTGLINGTSQKDVSDMYHTLITPAGFAFSIWSLIYGLLFISLIVMLVKSKERYYEKAIDSITPYLWISFITNMIWIVTFSYLQIGISTLFIFIYLISLTMIVQKLRQLNHEKRWLLPLTFGLNTGWLFIATVVNIAAFLVQIEWNGFGIADNTWTLIIMGVSFLLASFVLFQIKNAAFPLPIAWAFFAINRELQTANTTLTLEIFPLVLAVLFVILALYFFVRNDKNIYPLQRNTYRY